jgi:hypothetical protein
MLKDLRVRLKDVVMSHVVIRYQWAWRSGTDSDELMAWIGQMSEVGWELKGMTAAVHTRTVRAGYDEQFEIIRVVMQRPHQTVDGLGSWKYPG